jgi:hypothetical protein
MTFTFVDILIFQLLYSRGKVLRYPTVAPILPQPLGI